MAKVEVRDIYKAAYLFSRLSLLPRLVEDTKSPGTYIFLFDDSENIRREINSYLQNADLKGFIEGYKYLRSLIYQEKNRGNNHDR